VSREDGWLRTMADALDDIESTRIANENRLRTLQQDGHDGTPQAVAVEGLVSSMRQLETETARALTKTLRQHPLGPWVRATVGVGEKQGARLIAAIGDPYWHPLYDRPRRVSELWAYAGLHTLPVNHLLRDIHGSIVDGNLSGSIDQLARDAHGKPVGAASSVPAGHAEFDAQELNAGGNPGLAGGDPDQCDLDTHLADVWVAARRRKGIKANWSDEIKKRAYLVAESCMKQRTSPYRALYEKRKANTEGRVHAVACVRCGPSGKPALIGSPWSDGHRHADALRIVSKAILRDLWRESKRLHQLSVGDHRATDTQRTSVSDRDTKPSTRRPSGARGASPVGPVGAILSASPAGQT
jgi:hypothetical protein